MGGRFKDATLKLSPSACFLCAMVVAAFAFYGGCAKADSGAGDYALLKIPQKLALVVGNAAYQGAAQLPGSQVDADNMAKELTNFGFEVTVATHFNTREQFVDLDLLPFIGKIEEGAVVIFYYSGHGFTYQGESYLVPLQVPDSVYDTEVFQKFLSTTATRSLMEDRKPSILIMFLDACRDLGSAIRINPKSGGPSEFVEKGLAQPRSVSENVVIGYSAEAGKTSLGSAVGAVSPYTNGIVNTIGAADLELDWALKMVRQHVRAATQMQQSPWVSESSSEFFYFNPSEKTVADFGKIWAAAIHDGTTEAVQRFLAYYGASPYGAAARKWMHDHPTTVGSATGSGVSPKDLELAWGRLPNIPGGGGDGAFVSGLTGALKWNQTMDFESLAPDRHSPEGSSFAGLSEEGTLGADATKSAAREKIADAFSRAGEAVLVADLPVKAQPTRDAPILTRLPSGSVVNVDGVDVDSDSNVWLKIFDKKGLVGNSFIKIPNSTKIKPVHIGNSLKEFDVPLSTKRLAGLVDEVPVLSAVKDVVSDGKSISWISLSMPKVDNKRAQGVIDISADYLKYVLESAGISRNKILTIRGGGATTDVIHVRVFGNEN